ncbi:autotransporter outer membrane beta-barrel domain-containing protein [Escherichia coli]|nr:autotransporter outer membrane beta-barrel domain-containing protein [Escherichia coli]
MARLSIIQDIIALTTPFSLFYRCYFHAALVHASGHQIHPRLGEVRTGVEAKVNNNLSLWGNVGVQLGDKGYSDTQGMLGVKYSW